jgi:ion channel-forming bestrophin family protein
MIVRPRPSLLHLFFILRGSVVTRIFPQVIVVFALSALIVGLRNFSPGLVSGVGGPLYALLGIALSIFLGFRNNACYDRWWEARREWGLLITAARDFARQTLILNTEARAFLLNLVIVFARALVHHLRPGPDAAAARARLPADLVSTCDASRNIPDLILRRMGAKVADLRSQAQISDIQFGILDATISRMSAVLAACERIRNTPVPFGYTLLLHRTAYIFCFLLPFGFAGALGWGTPFASALVAYTFFGLDALGDELEEPFGNLPNDLPIEALADTIEINLREALGETDLPSLPQPKDFVLM